MNFRDYMTQMSYVYDLHKEIDGTLAALHVVLGLGTNASVYFDEINTQKRSLVRSACFMPPIDRSGRDRFLEVALNFNRNAISVLDAGLVPHPKDDRAFCVTWYVPKREQSEVEWNADLGRYEGLVIHAGAKMKQLTEEWANYRH